MIRTGWHATNNAAEILATGKVRPMRMHCVYLFNTLEAAALYADKFHCTHVCRVSYDTKDVAGRWKPAYAEGGQVIRLKKRKTAKQVDPVFEEMKP